MGVVVRRAGGRGGPPRPPGQQLAGAPKGPWSAIARVVAAIAPGLIQQRTKRGRDIHDATFTGYSKDYRDKRLESGWGGEVDLWLSGGMVASVRMVSMTIHPTGFSVVIAPGPGTSPRVGLGKGARRRPGGRAPEHAIKAAYHHYGTSTLPARPWLALSPTDRASLHRQLADAFPGLRIVGRI